MATDITGDELIRKIQDGERDFAQTRLVVDGGLDKRDGFAELQAYLQEQDLRANPINFGGADWRGVRAVGLFWERTKMAGADLRGADLREASLRGADLVGARLNEANLSGATFVVAKLGSADFSDAIMRGADMYECNATDAVMQRVDLSGGQLPRATFRGVDFTGAILTGVLLYKTDLRGAKGLDTARDLATGHFFKSVVTPAEHAAIWSAIQAQPLFDVRDE